ncbi:zinc transporter ZIP4-like isoform X2 [Pomacea canaliculata]|uniref:zinc transporter ZIP4-like isoform X2 n=1 Tax=Pomacea canaliculata TaxID=400727 RepID=UPI000D733925|nr:zinc transporter ZIP4-like isoform X2 [Pomacea canaliculata]
MDPQRWVDGVCRPTSRRDKRNEMGDDDDDDDNVHRVNNNIENSVQRAIQNLEAKMVVALAHWNPAHILGKVWTGLSDEAFLQHQQCFHIRREVVLAREAMRPVSAGVCHLELWNFLKRLTGTVLYKLLRGIENILTDARSSPSDNNMTTTQSVPLASGLLTVSQNFSALEIVGFVFPNHTGVFSVQQFYQMCPVLLQQVTMVRHPVGPTAHVRRNEATVSLPDLKKVTVIEATGIQSYGLGTVSVAVITLCSFVGAVLVRVCRGLGHHYAMAAMLALAFGNLCGDAVLHLLPKALESHDSGRSAYTLPGNIHVDVSVVKGFCLLFSVYIFWLLELFTSRYYRHQPHTKKDARPDTTVKTRHQDIDPRHRIPMSDMREEMEMTMQTNQMTAPQTSSYEIISARPVYPSKPIVMEVEENVVTSVHLVWMIVVGDVIHNLADGLAIGAAFSHSLPLGLCTSLAVVCHELPHELGDFAILLSTGMPMKRALLLNVLTGLAAFVGLYTGVALGSDHLQRQWVLMSVAGMFLYVSLADLVPELVHYFRLFQNVRMFLVQNVGLLSGFALMFGLVLLEDKMRFLPEKITAHT